MRDGPLSLALTRGGPASKLHTLTIRVLAPQSRAGNTQPSLDGLSPRAPLNSKRVYPDKGAIRLWFVAGFVFGFELSNGRAGSEGAGGGGVGWGGA